MSVLIDTSFLLAAMFNKDENHQQARQAMQHLKGENVRLVPSPVAYELFYMIATRTTYERAVNVFTMLQSSAFEIVALNDSDMRRMTEIMQQYSDAEFDFADTALMAVAERLGINQIYTFDRRDFSIYRPRHNQSFELLP
jgi:predicted nucleic acid-binding protein